MYNIVCNSGQPLEGDNWQDSFLKNYKWVLLKKVQIKSEEPHKQSPDDASELLLMLSPQESDMVTNDSNDRSLDESKNKVNSTKQLLQCDQCNKTFKLKRNFDKHKCETTNSRSARCEICHKTFYDYSTLIRHIRLHSGMQPFKCEICRRRFNRSDNLRAHLRVHESKLNNANENKRITYRTYRSLELKRKSSVSDCPDPFICKTCGKKFLRKTSLIVHMRLHLPFLCCICNNSFSMKHQLIDHLEIHENEEPSKLSLAWKLVMNISDITKLPINTAGCKKNHAFQCKVCLRPFSLRSHLAEHERIHTGQKPFECDICYKKVSSRGILNIHRRIHTGERPYQCPSCPRTFIEKTKLNLHMRFHTGDRPYECSICYKTFARTHHLKDHSLVHTNEKPYKCDICYKSFVVKKAYNNHKRTHTKRLKES